MTFLETLFMILFSVALGVAIYFVRAYLYAKNTIKEQNGTIKCLNEALERKEIVHGKDQS